MGDRMSHHALEALVEQVRSLPDGGSELGLPRAAISPAPAPAATASVAPAALRSGTASWLTALASRLETALPAALATATAAWDQADTFVIFDAELRDQAIALRRAAEALAAADDAEARVAGLEAALGIDAAVGLVSLLERRFAAILRLRLRSATPELTVDGRPFLDVAAALAEAGRRWR
jgi:hypothetical protein